MGGLKCYHTMRPITLLCDYIKFKSKKRVLSTSHVAITKVEITGHREEEEELKKCSNLRNKSFRKKSFYFL